MVDFLTTSDLSTFAESGEIDETSDVESLHSLNAPDLPGLVLVNPDISSWEGQIIYLDFDGAQDITYNGPVVVEGIDVPAFYLEGTDLAGQEQEIISQILVTLEQQFEGTGILFTTTTTKPDSGLLYSTIYVGGDDSAFVEYGSFLGLAEQVDIGNQDLSDNGFVFSNNIIGGHIEQDVLVVHLAGLISHETGHLLGYEHLSIDFFPNPLSALAFDAPTWMLADDVSYTRSYDPEEGDTFEVFDRDLSLEFFTPDNWTWTPDCFDDDGDPLIDISGLRTGFDAGWSFDISRSNDGNVQVSNTAYNIEVEVLGHSVLDITLPTTGYAQDIPYINGSWNVDFNPSFDSNLEWQGVTGEVSLDFNFLKDITLWYCPVIGIPFVASLDLGLEAGIDLGLSASITPELNLETGRLSIKEASFDSSIAANLNGFGQLTVFSGLGSGRATIGGRLEQEVIGEYSNGQGWSWSAPGSLSVTGSAFVKAIGIEVWAEEFDPWVLGLWDFLSNSNSPAPPTGSISYELPENLSPVVTSFCGNPNPVTRGNYILLPVVASDPDGYIDRVAFYWDSNYNGTFEIDQDDFVGVDISGVNDFSISGNIDYPSGTQRFFARAQDNDGLWSDTVSTLIRIENPKPSGSMNLSAKTSENGSKIYENTWQKDDDPYMYWDEPGTNSSIVGYSYAIDGYPNPA